MSFHETLEQTRVRHLGLPEPRTVRPTALVETVIKHMRSVQCACALVVDERGALLGIFTERDVLNKVIGRPETLGKPVRELMTPAPVTISNDTTVRDAIDRMSEGAYRNLPVVDGDGKAVASLNVHAVVQFIAEHYPQDVYNLPPRPEQQMPTPEGA